MTNAGTVLRDSIGTAHCKTVRATQVHGLWQSNVRFPNASMKEFAFLWQRRFGPGPEKKYSAAAWSVILFAWSQAEDEPIPCESVA